MDESSAVEQKKPNETKEPLDAEAAEEEKRRARLVRLYGSVALSGLLLFASFHPLDVGLLAWIALVPMLVTGIRETRRAAFSVAYFATFLAHLLGLAWIGLVAPPGWLMTTFLEGFYGIFAIAYARFMRRRGLPLALTLPPLWVFLELLRGNLTPFIRFPWLFLGHTQHARTTLLQVLDVTSVYGVTFLVVAVNAFLADVALHVLGRRDKGESPTPEDARRFAALGIYPIGAIVAALIYGTFRVGQVQNAIEEGPRVLAVQVDFEQKVKDSDVSAEAIANTNLRLTREALATGGSKKRPDVIIWSETMWPWPVNTDRPDETVFTKFVVDRLPPDMGQLVLRKDRELFALARDVHADILVGAVDRGPLQDYLLHPIARVNPPTLLAGLVTRGVLSADEVSAARRLVGAAAGDFDLVLYFFNGPGSSARLHDRITEVALELNPRAPMHNSVYHITPEGRVADRYDKINLVPASEFIPGKDTLLFNWFYEVVKSFVPPEFTVFEPGKGPQLMVVHDRDGKEWPLAPNLCFEVSFPELLRESVRKGALAHVCPSNDGWFERSAEIGLAHDQSIFRAIESRRAVIRVVNRGISMFVDPLGRTIEAEGRDQNGDLASLHVEATLNEPIRTTRLTTFYTRFGDAFAFTCGLAALAFLIIAVVRGRGTAPAPSA